VPSTYQVTVVNSDSSGNYWRETLPINDALLKIMRFARTHPQSICTIELREMERRVTPADERILERGNGDNHVPFAHKGIRSSA
jgi:hypothetical protein